MSFTATVSPNTGSTAPTGTIQFKIDGTNFGSSVLLSPSGSNGVATSGSTSTLTVAGSPHAVEAVYTPTGAFTTSTGTLSGGQVIAKATPTATLAVNNSPQTYNGSPQAATVGITASSVPGAVSNVKYDGSATAPTNAGTYAVTADFVPTDSANYNSLIGLSAGNFVIDKAPTITTVSCGAGPFTYNGNPHTPCTASVTGPGGLNESLTVNYTNNVNAGTATASASYAESANYQGSSDSKNFEIAKAATATTVSCGAGPFTYNGNPHTPCTASVTGPGGLNEALTVNYTNNVNAGTATASASYAESANYQGSSDSKNFEIIKAPVMATAGSGSATYDGATKAPSACTVTGAYTGDLSCTNNPASVGPGAGTTTIAPVVSGMGLSNFEITSVNGSYTIEKAQSVTTVTFEAAPYVHRGTPYTATAVVTGAGGLNQALSVVYSGNCTYVTVVNGCTATAAYAGDANHHGSNDSKSITITTAFAYDGFYAPIGGSEGYGNGGSYAYPVKSFKLGSTIPVKFGATWLNGSGPLITGVHTLQAIKYSNSTVSEPAIDATPTDSATIGNQFRLTGTDWHFNLSTKNNGFSAGTWKLIATLVDGSQHTVWIAIKK